MLITLTRYAIETPPYSKGRIEPDERGTLVKFEDVEQLLLSVESFLKTGNLEELRTSYHNITT